MTLEEYFQQSGSTDRYQQSANGPNYWGPSLELAGETGEAIEQVKKLYRDDKGVLSEERKAKIRSELGDVLWALSSVTRACDLTLDDIARDNLAKIARRLANNTIHGEGSAR